MTDARAHAALSASTAPRWIRCPGSVRMAAQVAKERRPVHEFTERGTRRHAAAEWCLEHQQHASTWRYRFGASLSEEGIEAVQSYLDTIGADQETMPHAELLIECKADLSFIAPGMYSYADAILVTDTTAIVYDYKDGRVPGAPDSHQLTFYALHCWHAYDVERVEVVIVQPHAGGVKRKTFHGDALEAAAVMFERAAKATQALDAEIRPGLPQCRYCPAAFGCSALHSAVLVPPTLHQVQDSPEHMAATLDRVELAEATFKQIRSQAFWDAKQGRAPTGWKLIQGRPGNRRWPPEAAAALEAEAVRKGADPSALLEPAKLKSPAQVEKLLGKGAAEGLTTRPEGAPKLVREEEPGTPYTPAAEIAKEFG